MFGRYWPYGHRSCRTPTRARATGDCRIRRCLTPLALDLLELVEFAWHDCYGEVSPPDDVIDDILAVSGGRLDWLIGASRLAIEDVRDLRVAADQQRSRQQQPE